MATSLIPETTVTATISNSDYANQLGVSVETVDMLRSGSLSWKLDADLPKITRALPDSAPAIKAKLFGGRNRVWHQTSFPNMDRVASFGGLLNSGL